MRDEDRPPRSMWLDDDALSDHFERVKERQGSGGSGADNSQWEDIPSEQNELTRNLRGK